MFKFLRTYRVKVMFTGIVVGFMLLNKGTLAMAMAPNFPLPMPNNEKDPKFHRHPAAELSDKDVKGVKIIEEKIKSEVSSEVSSAIAELTTDTQMNVVPVLEMAPENAIPGTMFYSELREQLYVLARKDIAGKIVDTWQPLINHQYGGYDWRVFAPESEYIEYSLSSAEELPYFVMHVDNYDDGSIVDGLIDGGYTIMLDYSDFADEDFNFFVYLVRLSDDPNQQVGPWAWDTNRLYFYAFYRHFGDQVLPVSLPLEFSTEDGRIIFHHANGNTEIVPPGCYGLVGETIMPNGQKTLSRLGDENTPFVFRVQ